jgi:HSF-type DNA-binding
MLVLLQIEKEQNTWIESNASHVGAEPPVPPMEWCTRGSRGESDHVIAIYDLDRLVKELLPRFAFALTRTSSFLRKLCRWGFRQVSTAYEGVRKNYANRPQTSLMYGSIHFRRGNFALLSLMRSNTAEKRRYEESLAAACHREAHSAANRNLRSLPKASSREKRSRVEFAGESAPCEKPRRSQFMQEDAPCQGEVQGRSSGASAFYRSTNQHLGQLDLTRIPATLARASILAANSAPVAPITQRVDFAQQSLQHQAVFSAAMDPSHLQILALFGANPVAGQLHNWILPMIAALWPPSVTPAIGSSQEVAWQQGTASYDLISRLMQLLQSVQQPHQHP